MTAIQLTPSAERPRERCLTYGAECLSLREVVALILGSGPPGVGCLEVAAQIVKRSGEGMPSFEEECAFFSAMETSPQSHLSGIAGIGEAQKARVSAAFELGRRYARYRVQNERSLVLKPSKRGLPEAALDRILLSRRTDIREWLGFVPLHRSGQLGELCIVEHGVRTHVNTDPWELFARLLALRPRGFYLFHNHPSGDVTPSSLDIELTRQVGRLSEQLGVRLLGHGIVSSRSERWIVL